MKKRKQPSNKHVCIWCARRGPESKVSVGLIHKKCLSQFNDWSSFVAAEAT